MLHSDRTRLDYLEAMMALPVYDDTPAGRAPMYSIIGRTVARKDGLGFDRPIRSRIDGLLYDHIDKLCSDIPGLSVSAAVRLLIAVGLENLEAVKHYTPEILPAAVRPDDTASQNSARLASMVCPLTATALQGAAASAGRLVEIAAFRDAVETPPCCTAPLDSYALDSMDAYSLDSMDAYAL